MKKKNNNFDIKKIKYKIKCRWIVYNIIQNTKLIVTGYIFYLLKYVEDVHQ